MINLIDEEIKKTLDAYPEYIGLIDRYITRTHESKTNWLATSRKSATYRLHIKPHDNLWVSGRPTRITLFVDNSDKIHTDAYTNGLTDFQFRQAYCVASYLEALTELKELVNAGKFDSTYKPIDVLLFELNDSIFRAQTKYVYPYLISELNALPRQQAAPFNINEWLCYPDGRITDANYKTELHTSYVPFDNPLHLSTPTAQDVELVDKFFDVYFDQQARQYLYNWLGAVLMNVPQKDLKVFPVITGPAWTGKSGILRKILLNTLIPKHFQLMLQFRTTFAPRAKSPRSSFSRKRVVCFEDVIWDKKAVSNEVQALNVDRLESIISNGVLDGEEISSLLIGISYRKPTFTNEYARLKPLILSIPIRTTLVNVKEAQLDMDVEQCSQYILDNIDSFTKVFVNAYLSNPSLLSTSTKEKPLPSELTNLMNRLTNKQIPTIELHNEVEKILSGDFSLVAKKDDDYVYINISAKGLASVGITDRKMAVTILKNYGEETPNPINFRTETESTKARAIKIKLQTT